MVTEDRLEVIASGLSIAKEKIAAAAKSVGRDSGEVSLIVVTKTFPKTDVAHLYNLGVRDFGENRDQDGSEKAADFHPDAKWHFQGQLQSNKIKSILNWADVIHSVADLDHAKRLNDRLLGGSIDVAKKQFPILIQISLDQEKRVERNGIDPSGLNEFADAIVKFEGLELKGLMAVAPISGNPDSAFTRLAETFGTFLKQFPEAKWLSAGMSGDFESAIRHGATHVRIGSSILGNRSYL